MARRYSSRRGGSRRGSYRSRRRSSASRQSRRGGMRRGGRSGNTVRLVIDTTGAHGMPVTPEALRQHLVSTMQQPVQGPRKASM